MAGVRVVNMKRDVEDLAPRFGFSPNLESRFARDPLGLDHSGVSYFRIAPDYRVPFGHRHSEQEEIYVVVSGSARIKLDDEIVELEQWDVVGIPPETWRALEGGPDGAEVLAFGSPTHGNEDTEMERGWWGD